jgi:hypothetical protein
VATYRVFEIPGVPFPARAFRLTKLAGGSDPEAGHYDVLIDPAGRSACECRGFLRHGTACKHIGAVTALAAAGAFDPPADLDPPARDWPSERQLADDADRDVPECYGG